MPTFRVTGPDGRTFRVNAPEGSTKEDAMAYIKASKYQQAQPQTQPGQGAAQAAAETSTKDAFFAGAGRQLTKMGRGIAQLSEKVGETLSTAEDGALGIYADLLEKATGVGRADVKAMFDASEQARAAKDAEEAAMYAQLQQASPYATGAGEVTAAVAATAPVPALSAASIPGKLAMPILGRLGTAAATNSALGAVTAGLDYAKSDEERQANMMRGAAFGAGGTALFHALGKTINAFRKVYDDSAGAKIAQQLDDAGFRSGIADVLQVDPTKSVGTASVVKKIDDFLANVPLLGTSGRKGQQVKQVTDYLTKLKSDFMARLPPGATDADAAVELAIESAHQSVKTQAKQLFDQVGQLAGNKPVPMTNMLQQAQELIASEKLAGKAADPAIMREFSRFTDDIAQNFNSARAIRAKVGDMIDKYQVSDPGMAAKYTRLKAAIDLDLDAFGNSGGVAQAYRAANKFYKESVVPFVERGVIKKIENGQIQADSVIDSFVKQGKWSQAKKVYDNVNDNGKRAIEYAVIDKALNAAQSGEHFLASKFASEIGKYESLIGRAFPKDVKTQIEGARKLMQHMSGADNVLVRSRTGFEGTAVAGTTAAAFLSPKALAIPVGFRAIFGSEAGKRFLYSAAELNPKSPQFKALAEAAKRYMQRANVAMEEDSLADL